MVHTQPTTDGGLGTLLQIPPTQLVDRSYLTYESRPTTAIPQIWTMTFGAIAAGCKSAPRVLRLSMNNPPTALVGLSDVSCAWSFVGCV
jgi:hypothetical protein